MPALLNMGTILIEEAIVVVSSRQHLKGAYNRAREMFFARMSAND